jgi:DNA polymerase alpha subunit A
LSHSDVNALDIDSFFDDSQPKQTKSKVYHAPAMPSKPISQGHYLSLNTAKSGSLPRSSFISKSLPIRPLNDDDALKTEEDYQTDNGLDYSDTFVAPLDDDHCPEMPAFVKDEPVEKISIAKTTKKLNVAAYACVKKPAEEVAFKQEVVDYDVGSETALSLAAIGSGFSSQGSEGDAVDTGSSIPPSTWLQSSVVTNPESAEGAPQTEEFVHMYWLDACESQGVIYIFGKIPLLDPSSPDSGRKYVSGCVAVHGVERNLFVLPAATESNGISARADMGSVYQDISKLLVPNIIPKSQGQQFRCKPVKRKYAFELEGVPREEMEYLKVKYSAKYPAPSVGQCQKHGSVEHIFGSTSSPLELFMLKRKLMGPGWIKIRNPRASQEQFSWCKIEFGVENPKFIEKVSLTEVPPLTLLSVSMKTALNPASHMHEIISLSGVIHRNVDPDADTDSRNTSAMKRFTFVRQLGLSCGTGYPTVFPHDLPQELKKQGSGVLIQFPNERAMLHSFFARLYMEDPDLIASHNLFGFEFDVLLSRSVENKVAGWSKLGRLRRTRPPRSINDRDVCSGRILCDTYKAAKEFLRETTYSLTSLSFSQLKYERVEVDPIEVPKYFFSSQDILKLMHHTSTDAYLVLLLVLKLQVVPLTKQLTNLSGNLWSRTMRGARAERIEYLLLHEFHSLKYVLPEKKQLEDNKTKNKKHNMDADDDDEEVHAKAGGVSKSRGKAAYAGGLVLEPKKGLYDTYILLLDFNSLYPSIIQEYNLCFTTINWTQYVPKEPKPSSSVAGVGGKRKIENGNINADQEDEDLVDDPDAGSRESNKALPPLPDSAVQQGVLPRVIKTLVDRRRAVKGLLKAEKDPVVRQQLDIRQKAIKLTANSMYGCLGFAFSRFCARPIAALVTSMGREALQRTVDLATNQFGLDVIYGDTDSVMINTGSTDLAHVKSIGNLVKKDVNKMYKSLELDLDGIFKSMLLLKKKKYAAITITEEFDGSITYAHEMKGLDLVRRDWCPLSKDAGKYVVQQILSGMNREEIVQSIHEYLSSLAAQIRNEDISRFVITKGLNKSPKDYPDCSGQAHLQVALAMLKANKSVNVGDHIPYLICVQVVFDFNSSALH